jgi:hypothetical protein
MYSPTMSVSFSSKRMSLETLKVLLKCNYSALLKQRYWIQPKFG